MPAIMNSTNDENPPLRESVAPDGVKLLLERFPHLQLVSLQLLGQNEEFRDLCEEYAACTSTSERLEKLGADAALRKEYSALRLRLEAELLGYLRQHGDDKT